MLQNGNTQQTFVTVQEAARISGYHAEHIRRLIREGKVRASKPWGRDIAVDRASLERYINSQRQPG